MATTPQSVPEMDERPLGRKPTYEEFADAIRRFRAEVGEEKLAAWDLDAEMEAEHQAILNGADI